MKRRLEAVRFRLAGSRALWANRADAVGLRLSHSPSLDHLAGRHPASAGQGGAGLRREDPDKLFQTHRDGNVRTLIARDLAIFATVGRPPQMISLIAPRTSSTRSRLHRALSAPIRATLTRRRVATVHVQGLLKFSTAGCRRPGPARAPGRSHPRQRHEEKSPARSIRQGSPSRRVALDRLRARGARCRASLPFAS